MAEIKKFSFDGLEIESVLKGAGRRMKIMEMFEAIADIAARAADDIICSRGEVGSVKDGKKLIDHSVLLLAALEADEALSQEQATKVLDAYSERLAGEYAASSDGTDGVLSAVFKCYCAQSYERYINEYYEASDWEHGLERCVCIVQGAEEARAEYIDAVKAAVASVTELVMEHRGK